MKIVTICIYTTICFLIVGCKKSTSTIRDYDTVENYATELEKLCLNPNRSLGFLCVVRQREIL